MSNSLDVKVAEVIRAVRDFVERASATFASRLDVVEKRVADLPAPERGEKGDRGETGEAGPVGRDGLQGPAGERGLDGAPGEKGERGEPGPAGRDGVDGAPGKDGAPGAAGDRGEKGVAGRDGIDGAAGLDGVAGERGEKGDRGDSGPRGDRGEKGDAGRDGAEIMPLLSIDPEKSYGKGTWAVHRGGLWLAREQTSGTDGWECIVAGIDDIQLSLDADLRTVQLSITRSNGRVVTREVSLPAMIYRGIWAAEEAYAKGDTSTRDGSLWILVDQQQKGAPGTEGSGWRLAAKRGRDGKDGPRGDRGAPGRDGRDGMDRGGMP